MSLNKLPLRFPKYLNWHWTQEVFRILRKFKIYFLCFFIAIFSIYSIPSFFLPLQHSCYWKCRPSDVSFYFLKKGKWLPRTNVNFNQLLLYPLYNELNFCWVIFERGILKNKHSIHVIQCDRTPVLLNLYIWIIILNIIQ